MEDVMDIWQKKLPSQLLAAINAGSGSGNLALFLRDILTEKEITEIAARLEAARLLDSGASYDAVRAATALSTRTIARISLWKKQGAGWYAAVLAQLPISNTHHSHISPAPAE
tara:strand:+ start:168 stop:506 length:339 start_codon:yes stop_codon:yes gene_type:complete